MKTGSSKLARFASVLGLAVWAVGPLASAQTQLTIEMTPRLTVSGSPGIYAVEWAQVLGGATNWLALTNVTLASAPVVFFDTAAENSDRRFYRAVGLSCTNAPDTNAPANPDPQHLVWMMPGTFTMGSPVSELDRDSDEDPQTRVTLTKGFWLGKYEMTQREYLAVMGTNPSYFTGDLDRPVEQVSWLDAVAYCEKLTQQERAAGRLPAGYEYRLPTEAEWEYACRAGTTTRFSYGDDPGYSQLGQYAWYGENSYTMTRPAGDYWESEGRYYTTHRVGTKLPNPWGLCDMHGNVWEWCADWYGTYPGGSVTDPRGPATGSYRVIRGCSWNRYAGYCRSAGRDLFDPVNRFSLIGFRVLLAPGQP